MRDQVQVAREATKQTAEIIAQTRVEKRPWVNIMASATLVAEAFAVHLRIA